MKLRRRRRGIITAPSGRGSVLPAHLTVNVRVSSWGFDAIKSRTAVNEGKGCSNSRLTRCLSWRTSGVRSIEARRRSFSDGMLPEIILGLIGEPWSAFFRYNSSLSRFWETFVRPAKSFKKFFRFNEHRRVRKDTPFDFKRATLYFPTCQSTPIIHGHVNPPYSSGVRWQMFASTGKPSDRCSHSLSSFGGYLVEI